ncbi:hypothetical protein RF11_07214 [Thelohanellus kitauei]|uniref:Uncharacterized protein n=1 Tax=Thelohanellus kitauei TaxID=669202 RepID=A0A0C2JVG3_THEKT|nr:hypothetical protein RF11_07214 [Thelohanellus kitauei]
MASLLIRFSPLTANIREIFGSLQGANKGFLVFPLFLKCLNNEDIWRVMEVYKPVPVHYCTNFTSTAIAMLFKCDRSYDNKAAFVRWAVRILMCSWKLLPSKVILVKAKQGLTTDKGSTDSKLLYTSPETFIDPNNNGEQESIFPSTDFLMKANGFYDLKTFH